MISMLFVFVLALVAFAWIPSKNKKEDSKKRPNILFLAIDDLSTELGCYGSPIAISSNIEKLAAEALLFDNAYCQQPICCPSRASLMTGGRLKSIGIINDFTDFREVNPDYEKTFKLDLELTEKSQ